MIQYLSTPDLSTGSGITFGLLVFFVVISFHLGFYGGLGALCRYFVQQIVIKKVFGIKFPLGTLIANCVACFLVGIFAGTFTGDFPPTVSEHTTYVVAFCGGFSTLSTVTLETVKMFTSNQQVQKKSAIIYILLQVVVPLMLTILGFQIAQW
jgi:CrcB protein